MKIVVTGAAGLVGQNLVPRLKAMHGNTIVAYDKHPANTRILRQLHPDLHVIDADLAEPGPWQTEVKDADCVIIAHAQIGGLVEDEFIRNNIVATEHLLDCLANNRDCRLIHLSSSVVNSAAVDWYTESKKRQEQLVRTAGHPTVILRPTLMFGRFDRKHLGWLARFMKKVPLFPVPGNGRYLRQPLYVGDLCRIIEVCVAGKVTEGAYDISGQERIEYIELMRLVRDAVAARTPIIRIPYGLLWWLLRCYALIDSNPPFTTRQLEALVTPDEFAIIDWPEIFGISATPLATALKETFRSCPVSSIVLDF
jgi:nucleoside-diphosphate-sugar epimerase